MEQIGGRKREFIVMDMEPLRRNVQSTPGTGLLTEKEIERSSVVLITSLGQEMEDVSWEASKDPSSIFGV